MSSGEATVYIKHQAILGILAEEGGIEIPSSAETLIGGLKINEEGELEIGIAWDTTDNHPSSWAVPPSFMRKEE